MTKDQMTPLAEEHKPATTTAPRKATLLQTVRIVVSMLFMVGRNRDYAATAPKIDPLQLAFVAIIGAALVIGGLVTLASFLAR
ncbi:MAG: DUF2970 domain-containing protein [Betaproteobacteria bacterium]